MTGKSSVKRELSLRAKRPKVPTLSEGICFFVCLFLLAAVDLRAETRRAKILGIEQVQIITSDVSAETEFFRKIGLLKMCPPDESLPKPVYSMTECGFLPKYTLTVGLTLQIVSLWPMPTPRPANLIQKIVFATDDVPRLRRYLKAHGITPNKAQKPDASLTVVDADGNSIEFVQRYASLHRASDSSSIPQIPIPLHLIHTGFVVHDRVAMDHFYKDILGFRPYWHGGMKDDQDDWVALQVPDGTDWVEFMLNISLDASKHTLGVMNHIALGVPDIHAVQKQLLTNGMKLTEEPKIGRDGKWQLNVYDPDGTRVEFMEFTPAEKPCCSEFTGPHPKP
jgi:catechol 2,3-dioxygenase-like lactoylglutathione lyase family enzyme